MRKIDNFLEKYNEVIICYKLIGFDFFLFENGIKLKKNNYILGTITVNYVYDYINRVSIDDYIYNDLSHISVIVNKKVKLVVDVEIKDKNDLIKILEQYID